MINRQKIREPKASNGQSNKSTQNNDNKAQEYLKEQAKNYLRIGTQYYRIINKPLASGKVQQIERKWTRQTIVEDHDKKIIQHIKKYIDFCNVPSHINYQSEIDGFYNKYRPLNYSPFPGQCESTKKFLKHIFGDQFELGLDYIKLLYESPKQVLPILCLVSTERHTGKSTFLKWMNLIFDQNMTVNTNQDFDSNFNSDWAQKLVIGIEETFIDKQETTERIKFLSTATSFKEESKGIDKVEIEFFGKFIFATNNEENFLPIDEEEIRYWVRKIHAPNNSDPDILEKIEKEIPAFLQFILDRGMSTSKRSRMWFTKEDIYTEALQKAKEGSRTFLEKEVRNLIREELLQFLPEIINRYPTTPENWYLEFTKKDITELLRFNQGKPITSSKLTDIIEVRWKLEAKNSSYTKYTFSQSPDGNSFAVSNKFRGRFFTFKAIDFLNDEEIEKAKKEAAEISDLPF